MTTATDTFITIPVADVQPGDEILRAMYANGHAGYDTNGVVTGNPTWRPQCEPGPGYTPPADTADGIIEVPGTYTRHPRWGREVGADAGMIWPVSTTVLVRRADAIG